MAVVLSLFHLSVVALNLFALWYDQMYVDLPFPSKEFEEMPFKCRGLFLTIWCLVTQTVYFCVALLNDIFGTDARAPKSPPLLRRIKDTLFSIAFPVALVVCVEFWGLYFIDKDLILPEHIERQFPKWLNHTMHTFILPFLIFELLLSKINYPSRRLGLFGLAIINVLYITWSHMVYFRTGLWMYPVLNKINWFTRIIFMCSNSVVSFVFYIVGEKLNMIVTPNVTIQYTNGTKKN